MSLIHYREGLIKPYYVCIKAIYSVVRLTKLENPHEKSCILFSSKYW